MRTRTTKKAKKPAIPLCPLCGQARATVLFEGMMICGKKAHQASAKDRQELKKFNAKLRKQEVASG